MSPGIEEHGGKLLLAHAELQGELVQIPQIRAMTFRIDDENGLQIGKPRFDPPEYQWPVELFARLRDHLQEIWKFFANYSYWFDDSLFPLLHWDERRISKDSIVYLLQHDVWGVRQIYGAYLIEEEAPATTAISYFRFDKRVKTYRFGQMTGEDLQDWICNDAIRQIQDHFTFLWQKLEIEIKTCIAERFQKKETQVESAQYLLDQFATCKMLYETSKEACLALLGRVAEHWLILALGFTNSPKFYYLAGSAKYRGLINEDDKKMFDNISSNYNRLKHWTTFDVETSPLLELMETFEYFLER